MKVLITSGGTSVMIDDIRCITNLSRGRLGRDIAEVFIERGDRLYEEVCLLRSKDAFPVKYPIRPYRDEVYFTFDEYMFKVEQLCKKMNPDIIILSAAVSDYGVDKTDGKISSKDSLTLNLKPLPKVISKVRGWCPDAVICGFKLLSGATREELIDKARESIVKNNLDLVVANDWSTIKSQYHDIIFVTKDNFSVFNSARAE